MNYIEKLFSLKGKVIVITGGSGVLASDIGAGLVKAGATVILLGRSLERLKDKAKHIKASAAFATDVMDKKSVERACDDIVKQYTKVDVLLNAAGGNQPGATVNDDQSLFDIDLEAITEVNDLNFKGSVIPSLVFGQQMAKQGEGNIINFSSMSAFQVMTRVVGYSASKAAITNFTSWMATEMAKKFSDKIRINAIAPGFFVGNQNRALLINEDGSLTPRSKDILHNTPMNRFGEANELIGAVIFLISPSASFVTGTVLPVDGGFSIFSGV